MQSHKDEKQIGQLLKWIRSQFSKSTSSDFRFQRMNFTAERTESDNKIQTEIQLSASININPFSSLTKHVFSSKEVRTP